MPSGATGVLDHEIGNLPPRWRPIRYLPKNSPLAINQAEISEPGAKYRLVRIEVADFDSRLRGQAWTEEYPNRTFPLGPDRATTPRAYPPSASGTRKTESSSLDIRSLHRDIAVSLRDVFARECGARRHNPRSSRSRSGPVPEGSVHPHRPARQRAPVMMAAARIFAAMLARIGSA